MKILEIEILNNKAIKVFNVELNGNNLGIAGDAGTGKTTAVSALWEILTKGSETLTHGEKKGVIRIKVGDSDKYIIATRETTPKTSRIIIKFDKGNTMPIALFKTMLSDLSVNPHKIMDMKSTEQVKTLLKSAKLEIDIDALDREIAETESRRLDTYRAMEALKPGEEPEKAERVDIAKLLEGKSRADQTNLTLANLAEEQDRLKTEMEKIKTRLVEIDDYQKHNSHVDVSEITNKINTAQATNEKAAQHQAWEANNQKCQDAKSAHDQLDAKVKDKQQQRKDALESAEWPIDGLEIKEGSIYYNDILLQNLGHSEQMLVCAALAMNDILKHELHVVRMDGIESMSKEDFEALKTLFNGHGVQVLSTRVSRGDVEPGELIITDGVYGEEDCSIYHQVL